MITQITYKRGITLNDVHRLDFDLDKHDTNRMVVIHYNANQQFAIYTDKECTYGFYKVDSEGNVSEYIHSRKAYNYRCLVALDYDDEFGYTARVYNSKKMDIDRFDSYTPCDLEYYDVDYIEVMWDRSGVEKSIRIYPKGKHLAMDIEVE